MNDTVTDYAFHYFYLPFFAFLCGGAEIPHTLALTYRNSRSVFAHSACEYNPEVVRAGEYGTQKSEKGWNYFNLDIYHRYLKD